jgi:hypothetical protein
MEHPFIGKRGDVYNKLGSVAYFNHHHEEAAQWWEKAVKSNSTHFDSLFNLGMYNFLAATQSDSQMRADFSDDVFCHPSKGLYLNAVLNIAVGLRDDGVKKLTLFINEQEKKLSMTKRTSPKLEKSI